MFWGETKQLWEEGAFDYFHDIWNWMDITMIALYAASYSIQFLVIYSIAEKVKCRCIHYCMGVLKQVGECTANHFHLTYSKSMNNSFNAKIVAFKIP